MPLKQRGRSLKETVSVISSYPPCKDGYAWFTTVPFKALSDQVLIRYPCFCLFYLNCLRSFMVYPQRWLSDFLQRRMSQKLITFRVRKTMLSYALRVRLWIEHWYFCMVGYLKLLLYTPFKSICIVVQDLECWEWYSGFWLPRKSCK